MPILEVSMSALVSRQPPAQAGSERTARADSSGHHAVGFWLIAGTLLAAMSFSAVPTPLYPLYEIRDGFSSFTVTIVFAVYAVGVVASLMFLGHVSDGIGRKRVLLTALGLETIAAAIFLVWPDLPALIVARLISGIGIGMITATATAYLQELHTASRPDAGQSRFEIVSTVFNTGALGVGPLIAGAIAQFVAAPLRIPYVVYLVLLVLAIAAVAVSPETVERTGERYRYRPQRVSLVQGDLTGYLAATGGAFTAFAFFGLATSLAPEFVGGTLHHPSRLLAGAVVFAIFGAAAVAQVWTARMRPGRRFALGVISEAVGLATLAVGMEATSLGVFLVGGAVAGVGAGVLFKSALGQIASLAPAAKRGEALAGLFLVSYTGLIVPVLGVGVATQYVSPTTAMLAFTVVLLAMLAAVAFLGTRPRRDGADGGAADRAVSCA
jgi:MFS family permease